MHKQYGRKYWNNVCSKINKHHYRGNMHEYKKFSYIKGLSELIDERKVKNVLITDLFDEAYDCNGLFHRYQNMGKKTIGIDVSDIIIKRIKRRYSKADVKCCDVRKLPFKDNHFDLIVSPSTLDHFPKKYLFDSLKEMKRVLKKNGKLIVTLNNKKNIWLTFPLLNLLKINPYNYYTYSVSEVKKMLPNKLNVKKTRPICHLPFPLITSHFMNFLNKFKIKKHIYEHIEKPSDYRFGYYTADLLMFLLKKEDS